MDFQKINVDIHYSMDIRLNYLEKRWLKQWLEKIEDSACDARMIDLYNDFTEQFGYAIPEVVAAHLDKELDVVSSNPKNKLSPNHLCFDYGLWGFQFWVEQMQALRKNDSISKQALLEYAYSCSNNHPLSLFTLKIDSYDQVVKDSIRIMDEMVFTQFYVHGSPHLN